MSTQDGLRLYLSDRGTLRSCLYFAVALGLVVLVMWPRAPLESAIRTAVASEPFTVVSVCFLLFMCYLGARFGLQDVPAEPAAHLREYVKLTSVSLLRLVSGRWVLGLLHTLLLLLLGTPFLLCAMTAGGAGFTHVLWVLASIGAASLASRMLGFLGHSLLGTRRPVREILVATLLFAGFTATFVLAPGESVFRAVGGVLGSARAPLESLAADLGVSLACAAGGLAVLSVVRRKAVARG